MKIKVVKKRLVESAQVKSLDRMTEDEFADLINDVMDKVDKVNPVRYSTDIDARVKKINDDAKNSAKNDELRQEDDFNRAEERRRKTREAEKAKYNKVGGFESLQAFKDSLEAAMRLQVSFDEDEDETYAEPNKRWAHNDDVLVKGFRLDDVQGDIPSIDVYFDKSASWEEEDTRIGRDAINCLVDMENEGLIDLNIYYFANNVAESEDTIAHESGTGAWPKILQQIKSQRTDNVVIMTDDDMDTQPGSSWNPRSDYPTVTIPGCVWWLWRNGVAGKRITKELRGETDNEQFSFAR